MTIKSPPISFVVLAAFLLGAALGAIGLARAEPQPAFERALTERLVRAEEQQARSLDALVRATEKCKR
jgi:hypothetical protein